MECANEKILEIAHTNADPGTTTDIGANSALYEAHPRCLKDDELVLGIRPNLRDGLS
jgi:hypothetical protein